MQHFQYLPIILAKCQVISEYLMKSANNWHTMLIMFQNKKAQSSSGIFLFLYHYPPTFILQMFLLMLDSIFF